MHLSRQLAAIMYTDIVGYTALVGKDEKKRLTFLIGTGKFKNQSSSPKGDPEYIALMEKLKNSGNFINRACNYD